MKLERENQSGIIKLSPQEGSSLKDLIEENTFYPFPAYCKLVGMEPSNVYALLSGQRNVSIALLTKLLSGIGHNVRCTIQIEIVKQESQTGPTVTDADLQNLEAELFLGETLIEDTQSTCSSLETPQEEPKTVSESHSQDQPTKSFSDQKVSLTEYLKTFPGQ